MLSPNIYVFEFIGGPLDGLITPWAWFDTEEGREGEAKGIVECDGLIYETKDHKKAYYVEGKASKALLQKFLEHGKLYEENKDR